MEICSSQWEKISARRFFKATKKFLVNKKKLGERKSFRFDVNSDNERPTTNLFAHTTMYKWETESQRRNGLVDRKSHWNYRFLIELIRLSCNKFTCYFCCWLVDPRVRFQSSDKCATLSKSEICRPNNFSISLTHQKLARYNLDFLLDNVQQQSNRKCERFFSLFSLHSSEMFSPIFRINEALVNVKKSMRNHKIMGHFLFLMRIFSKSWHFLHTCQKSTNFSKHQGWVIAQFNKSCMGS